MAKTNSNPMSNTDMKAVDTPTTDSFKWRKEIHTLQGYFEGNESRSQTIRWLTRLRLLEPIPFQYMVPSEDMLPSETIRYFHIDRNQAHSDYHLFPGCRLSECHHGRNERYSAWCRCLIRLLWVAQLQGRRRKHKFRLRHGKWPLGGRGCLWRRSGTHPVP